MGNAWDDDAFAAEDSALPADQSAIGGDIQTMPVIREEDCSTAPDPELIVGDSVSPTTAVGDLHFLDENAILKTVSSLITDETHWKKAKPNVETASVTQKQAETETKKKERPKAKKEQDQKQLFEWSDEDELPLSALRDRMAKAKRPLALSRSEEDIINATIVRKVQMQLYMPHYFCKLSHVFVGEWGKLRINRASSAPLETPHHEERWVDSVVRDMQTNDEPTASKSFMEFIAMFNNYFNNADDRNVRAGSEPGLNSSSGDFFDEYTAQDGDDENDIMFGVKYSIRQRRINAPAVKRAIATVLSTKELDADMLNAQLEVARRLKLKEVDKLGDHDVSIINENDELDLSLTQSRKNGMLDLSAEEEQLQMREEEEMGEDPTCELHKGDVKVSKVTLEGRHTFSSLLLRVPDFVTGRTANDLNPVNAFSVLLHMCNENNLELAQRRDENGMVPPSAMGDFTILPSRKSKRRHQ
ncbi:unnamed protein product [Toxocara canis]|uniref:Condensin complex subunit 2 n=1 Tax=Toxocara canis TaxID=6265 RepID=A0A3P7GYS5_TOXCA|nr:unnamed protein product [Toxocara canis]